MRKTKARELVRFGANVRKRREARDWTQEQLAGRAEGLRTKAGFGLVSARFAEHRGMILIVRGNPGARLVFCT